MSTHASRRLLDDIHDRHARALEAEQAARKRSEAASRPADLSAFNASVRATVAARRVRPTPIDDTTTDMNAAIRRAGR